MSKGRLTVNLSSDFDRLSRHLLVARLVRATFEPGARILDLGGSQGFTSDILVNYFVVPVDLAGDDVKVRASAKELPFPEGTFDAALALDLLEHLPRSVRQTVIEELRRVSRGLVVVAGPFQSPDVLLAESDIRDLYQRLRGDDHRWLTEHLEFGLPALAEVQSMLSQDGWAVATTSSNPLEVWKRLQFCNFVGAVSGERETVNWVHRELATRFLDGGDSDQPAYRHILVASPQVDVKAHMASIRGTDEGRPTAWTSSDAIRALDEATAAMIGRHAKSWHSQARELERSSQVLSDLREQLSRNLTDQEVARSQIAGLEGRLQLTQHELARRSDELARKAHEIERAGAARHERLSIIRKGTEQAEQEAEDLRGEISRLAGWLDRLNSELTKLLRSRRWRLGDTIGSLFIVSSRRKSKKASDWIQQILVEYRTWRVTDTELMSPRPAGQADEIEAASMRYTTALLSVSYLRSQRQRMRGWITQLETRYKQLLSSTRWRIGNTLGNLAAPFGPRRRRERATYRIDVLLGVIAEAKVQSPWSELEKRKPRTPNPPRVEYEVDAAELQAAYDTYIANVEPAVLEDLVSPDPPTVRVVVTIEDTGIASEEVDATVAGWDLTSILLANHHGARPPGDEPSRVGEALNSAIEEWGDEWFTVVKPGDRLAPELRGALRLYGDGAAAVVFDEDVLGDEGREQPRFKPDFSPDWLVEYDYVRRGVAFRADAVRRLGGFSQSSADLRRDMLLRLAEAGERIAKVHAVLLHACPEDPDPLVVAEKDIVFARYTVGRRGVDDACVVEAAYGAHVAYRLPPETLVSIIIPFRDKPDLLRVVTDSIFRLTSHPSYEIVLVNNLSRDPETGDLLDQLRKDERVRLVDFSEPFNFSRAINAGVAEASGDVLILLNNDTKVLTPDWVEELCGYALEPGVGAVGALLRYPNGTIQHAGVVIGMLGFAAHLFAGEHPPFVPSEYLWHVRNCSAVTAACMAVAKDRFLSVNGFDDSFTLTGNDVDFCLRLLKAGYRNIFNPHAQLIHHEKESRAERAIPRRDQLLSLDRYQPFLSDGDPYFNRNLSRKTTRILPRVEKELGYDEVRASVVGLSDSVRERTSAEGFVMQYDATRTDLEKNAQLMGQFLTQRRVNLKVVNWFIPPFDHVYRGGIYTIMRFANYFSDRSGAHNRFVLCGQTPDRRRDNIEAQIREAFPSLSFELVDLHEAGAESQLPRADIGICTLWTCAYNLLRFNNCTGKFYFIQDFEPSFSPAGSTSGLIEETYRFGYVGLANTPGVAESYRLYGNEAQHFLPGVDRDLFHPADEPRDDDRVRIVFYGRPNNPRNGFELGAEALRRIKERFGEGVEIVSVGADYREGDFGLDGVLANFGVLSSIKDVAGLYRSCDIGVVFMFTKHPSYQPLEFMASGCATVSNVNEANLWLFRPGENSVLAPPTVSGIVEAISELVEDAELRSKIVAGGLASVADMDWERELELAYRFITAGAARDD